MMPVPGPQTETDELIQEAESRYPGVNELIEMYERQMAVYTAAIEATDGHQPAKTSNSTNGN